MVVRWNVLRVLDCASFALGVSRTTLVVVVVIAVATVANTGLLHNDSSNGSSANPVQ